MKNAVEMGLRDPSLMATASIIQTMLSLRLHNFRCRNVGITDETDGFM
jgi:hypothetical protein